VNLFLSKCLINFLIFCTDGKMVYNRPGDQLYRNTCNFPENDLSIHNGLSLTQCIEHCKNHPNCLHFAHNDAGIKTCRLKQSKFIPMTVTKNAHFSCGFLTVRSSQKCHPSTRMLLSPTFIGLTDWLLNWMKI